MMAMVLDPALEAELLADIIPAKPKPKEAAPEPSLTSNTRSPVALRVVTNTPVEAADEVDPAQACHRVAGCLIQEHGVFVETANGDLALVCSPMKVEATYADAGSRGWGKLVRLQSVNGNPVSLRIDNAELQSAPSKVLAKLADCGLEFGPDKKSQDRVIHLLKQWKPERHLLSVPQVGWASNAHDTFCVGATSIGSAEVLPPEFGGASEPCGSWQDWRDNVSALCVGNPMMILAVSLAFTGPLLSICGMQGGGLHFRGASSSGKTTLLTLANSVWSDRKSIRQWRATSNGIEALAQRSNDMLLALDELAEIHARELHGTIYMLANGVPKARMTKDVSLQEGPRWRLALISSGEISVAEKLREASLQAMAGHEVRLIDIEADNRRYGVFDELHGCQDGAELAEKIQAAARNAHGAVGRVFLEKLISRMAWVERLLSLSYQLTNKWMAQLPTDPDGGVRRVAQRFTIIALAGQLATKFGLTGWSLEAAEEAAEAAFLDWYDRTHSDKQDAASDALQRLESYLAANGGAIQAIGAGDSVVVSTEGWRDDTRLYLLPEVWSRIMAGLDEKAVNKALVEVGVLQPGENGRLMRKAPRSIPGRPRLFTLNTERLKLPNGLQERAE